MVLAGLSLEFERILNAISLPLHQITMSIANEQLYAALLDENENETEDMRDDQIDNLLRVAEQRSQQNPINLPVTRDTPSTFTVLHLGDLPRPYVAVTDHIAHVDSPRLLNDKERRLPNETRKLECQGIIKANPEVRYI